MILVTGATGTVGTHLVPALTARGAAVRAMTRDPAAAPVASGVEVVRGDFDDPASLAAAVAGVRAVFLLTAPPTPTPDHDLAMLAAARAAGVATVVKLSAIGTGETVDGRTVGAWHLRAEQGLRSSGLAWTVLRPSSFASNLLAFADTVAAGGPVPNLTGTARQGVVDPRDVAAAAAEVLTGRGHEGRTYTLTGPEPIGVPDQARVLSSVLGRTVTTVDVPLEVAREQLLGSGTDRAAVDAILTGVAWARAGHNAVVTQDVPRLLGRPATTFAAWANDHRDAFGARNPSGSAHVVS
ncbi:NAD(P)H-binding protein [Actinophytocola xanthii]|uniref:NAD(P)-dependent oxidoreductase n=1 Tax=Actinophytocola xanthii TaxID=1912961 RepID=A0A1Q8CUZ7_9PSEU|nr:NAD(P)H-binding protein [Actinophytocola xanthii]OLF18182.1 NAD(P)-dependent oxidoreductase [Actinophytocola xanthii]